jgi:drug/metabolite transporter, DME family
MSYKTGVLLVVIAGVLWSLMGLAIRLLDTATTWQVLFWRPVGMIPVLAGFIWWRSGGLWVPLRDVGLAGLVGALGLVLAFSGAVYALQSTTIANAVFLFSASPFFSAVLGWVLLRERVRPATWVAIAVAVLGMGIMVREGVSMGDMAGNLAAIGSAFGFAVFAVTVRGGKLADMLPAVILGGLLSMGVAAVVLSVQGVPLAPPIGEIAIIVAAGAVILGLGLTLFTLGSRVVPAAEATLLTMLEVILGPVWVWLILAETASPMTFVGGAVVLCAVALNAVTGLRERVVAPG